MERFTDKVVLITGAAGVLGRALSSRFASEGAAVVLGDLPGAGQEQFADELEQAGARSLAVDMDMTRSVSVAAAVSAAAATFGGVDVLVNNAGTEGGFASIEHFDDDVFDRTFAINVRGVYLGMKHAVPHLRERRGAVVNIASVAGLQGTPGMIAYGMSKHAVIGMTKSVAAEEAAAGVRVTAVCPAPVEGRMMRSIESGVSQDGEPDAVRNAYLETIPSHRYAEPEEVAAVVCFLASDDASYVTGSWHRVDGGLGTMSV